MKENRLTFIILAVVLIFVAVVEFKINTNIIAGVLILASVFFFFKDKIFPQKNEERVRVDAYLNSMQAESIGMIDTNIDDSTQDNTEKNSDSEELNQALLMDENYIQELSKIPDEEFLALMKQKYGTDEKNLKNINKTWEIFKMVLLIGGLLYIFSPIIALFIPGFINYAGTQSPNNTYSQPPVNHNRDIQIGNKNLNYSNLPINPLSEYNYKTKKQIYDIRKHHVMNSIFASSKYQPREEIFGQIEDGKPWYGLGTLLYKSADVIKGVSYRSKFINNPMALIDITNDIAYSYSNNTAFSRNEKTWTLLVSKLQYDPTQKLITATYKVDNSFIEKDIGNMPPVLDFTGINARDFGYDYASVVKYDNLAFKHVPNISTEIYAFKDFIHTGGSCKVPGGCNNLSPWQQELDFYLTSLPASITFKLWKNPPNSSVDGPDFYYKIKLEN